MTLEERVLEAGAGTVLDRMGDLLSTCQVWCRAMGKDKGGARLRGGLRVWLRPVGKGCNATQG